MKYSHSGIALLITVMFVIVITIAIGYGLKQVNSAAAVVKQEKFMYQSSTLLEDILKILQTSSQIKATLDANSTEALYTLISQAAFIPFNSHGLEMLLKIKSARAKFNPAEIDANNIEQIKLFMNNYNINNQYVDILLDNINGIKEDNSYNSTIFDEYPYLFRDYIASGEHLKIINDFYTKEYNDNALSKINFDNLFYYSSDRNIKIDLNYATPEVWEMLIGASKERAEVLSAGGGSYSKIKDLNLNDDELRNLKHFKTSFYEPILDIEVEIRQDELLSKIHFEYNIKTKKGSNFAFKF